MRLVFATELPVGIFVRREVTGGLRTKRGRDEPAPWLSALMCAAAAAYRGSSGSRCRGRNLGSRIFAISSRAASRCALVSWSVVFAIAAVIDAFSARSSARYIGFSSPLERRRPRSPAGSLPRECVAAARAGGFSLLLTSLR